MLPRAKKIFCEMNSFLLFASLNLLSFNGAEAHRRSEAKTVCRRGLDIYAKVSACANSLPTANAAIR